MIYFFVQGMAAIPHIYKEEYKMKRNKLIVFRTINCILVFTSFLMVVSCNRDNTDSIVGNPELDLENKGIELETIPYPDKDLPEITTDGNIINAKYHPDGKLIDEKYYYPDGKLISPYGKYELSSGKYKMVVGEALICPADAEYVYFHGRIRSDEWRNEFWIDTDPTKDGPHPLPYSRFEDGPYYEDPCKIRIYLDPPIDSNVIKNTTFGTLLTEYNFEVIVEIIREGELDNRCITSEDKSDTIAGFYIGRLISIFE